VALAIRAKLEGHRRREAQLSALFDTAGDLAALRDLDAVLRALVRRARTLVGTDVTYMTLNDPAEGDTYMRVTDGSVSAAFQQLRLGMGEGLGGLVAQTARPYASADYRVDSRFRHTRTIDAGVHEEGLRGILGVPMQLGTRVIGVLYAADRTPREFTQDAIALLSSLADHAAVAIDGARMLEETRTALADGPRDAGSLALRARRLGVDLAAPHCVAVLHCAAPSRARLAAEATRQARRLAGLAGTHGGEVALLAPSEEPGALARSLAADVGRALAGPVTVGSAGPAASHGRLREAHREALRCLQALQALGRTGEGGSLPELGFLGVLLGDRTDVTGYVRRVLGPVLDYDAQRGTELVRTLDAYYAQGASLARAKDELHVHVNTVVQRLERVRHLLGPDWNAPEHALEVQLALRLHRLGGSPPPEGA
jgi:hypothetical protein